MIKIRDRERRLFEFVDGVLVEKVMGYWESVLAAKLVRLLGNVRRRSEIGHDCGRSGDAPPVAWPRAHTRRFIRLPRPAGAASPGS